MEFVIITGLSGAGKTSALHAMEDIGFYCVDNLPSSLFTTFYNLCVSSTDKAMKKVAVVIDARGGDNLQQLYEDMIQLRNDHKKFKILFLNAKLDTLITRFKETRRRHPLADLVVDGSIDTALSLEISYLSPFKKIADHIIDSTNVSTKQLKERVTSLFLDSTEESIILTFMSFGFKYGMPTDCDTIFDVRCLPNPFYIDELRERTGLEAPVRDYVFKHEESNIFVEKLMEYLDYAVPLYRKEGKAELVVGIGCTGGKHRSVAIAALLKEYYICHGYKAKVYHRDIKKEKN
jgi:UPF0042 nucleotide-binding protein